MELCSASLSERYRRESIPVPEVLRIAVKIGSAIETAHRAGVLHRDIKPSNILLTAYGHPVLSDFGIASTLTASREDDSVGLSIPWSAPEVLLDEVPGSIASEVWAFAATVYSLLAGRSPFELPGGSNSSSDLMSRIARAKPQPIGRADVPADLEGLLRRAMSRRPELRPGSVLELVRELQLIETELGVPQTAIEVAMDDWALGTVADLEERTRLRPLSSAAKAPRRRRRRAELADAEYSPVGTLREGSAPGLRSHSRATGPTRPQATTWAIVVASLLVVALVVTALVLALRPGPNSAEIPVVTDISASLSGDTVHFSWKDPGLTANDRYQIQVIGGTSSIQLNPRFVVDGSPGDTVCITVAVNRDGKTGDPSAEKCVDVTDG
jgi:serine/threonine protein kinase